MKRSCSILSLLSFSIHASFIFNGVAVCRHTALRHRPCAVRWPSVHFMDPCPLLWIAWSGDGSIQQVLTSERALGSLYNAVGTAVSHILILIQAWIAARMFLCGRSSYQDIYFLWAELSMDTLHLCTRFQFMAVISTNLGRPLRYRFHALIQANWNSQHKPPVSV